MLRTAAIGASAGVGFGLDELAAQALNLSAMLRLMGLFLHSLVPFSQSVFEVKQRQRGYGPCNTEQTNTDWGWAVIHRLRHSRPWHCAPASQLLALHRIQPVQH